MAETDSGNTKAVYIMIVQRINPAFSYVHLSSILVSTANLVCFWSYPKRN